MPYFEAYCGLPASKQAVLGACVSHYIIMQDQVGCGVRSSIAQSLDNIAWGLPHAAAQEYKYTFTLAHVVPAHNGNMPSPSYLAGQLFCSLHFLVRIVLL